MKAKIEYIKRRIDLFAQKFKSENNDIITTEFIQDLTLKERVKPKFFSEEEEMIALGIKSWFGLSEEADFENYFEKAMREFKSVNIIEAPSNTSLKKTKKTWLNQKKIESFKWNEGPTESYRERYFEYLNTKGRSLQELEKAKESTLSILEGFGDPSSSESFFIRGMVVGSVQSGKTTNFNGVINSSIDMGYKLIIILSGITEDLRAQTQERVETEIIGPKLRGNKYLGVGEICNKVVGKDEVNCTTSRKSDFKKDLAQGNTQIERYNILVVKKNVSVLKNILLWLNDFVDEKNPVLNEPLLIIDDEADNASLNNMGHKGKEYATQINKEIRAILALFHQKTYLGYTATPFANVLQDRNETPETLFEFTKSKVDYKFKLEDNIFPEDFIELLHPSSHYIGIKHFFDTKDDNVIKIDPLIAPAIPETDYVEAFPPRLWKDTLEPTSSKERGTRAAKKDDQYPQFLPNSLKEAVRCFVLSVSVRDIRDLDMNDSNFYQPHNTMLVHISRFGTWQDRTRDLITKYIEDIKLAIGKGYSDSIFEELQFTWDKHYKLIVGTIKKRYLDPNKYQDDYMQPLEYGADVKSGIAKAIEGIQVKSINSGTGDNLYYPKKSAADYERKKYIAIGGNRLSRGFTLEGLTINYFLRATNNADTLMQMGRWFGYRIGYLDCCKLFTIRDNIEKFNMASLIMEDLELKFEQLSKMPDKTPKDFTIWIQNNPDIIKLTRANFLRDLHKMNLNFSSRIQQSSQFNLEKDKIIKSAAAFKKHVIALDWDSKSKPGYYIHVTDQIGLLKFLDIEPTSMLNLNLIGLEGYLNECLAKRKLTKWIIAIKNSTAGKGTTLKKGDLIKEGAVKQTIRRGPSENTMSAYDLFDRDIFKVKNAQIISASDFSIGLDDDQKTVALSEFRKRKKVEFIKKYPKKSTKDINDLVKKSSVPDFEYRKYMDESTGLLIIYPIQLETVFETNDKSSNEHKKKLKDYQKQKDLININVPLIGYAVGFPDIRGVYAGTYVTRHLSKELEDMTLNELKKYIEENNIDINLSDDWTRKELFLEIQEYDEEEEFDDNLEN